MCTSHLTGNLSSRLSSKMAHSSASFLRQSSQVGQKYQWCSTCIMAILWPQKHPNGGRWPHPLRWSSHHSSIRKGEDHPSNTWRTHRNQQVWYIALESTQTSNISLNHAQHAKSTAVKEQNVTCTSVKVYIRVVVLYLAVRQLRFSLSSGAVTTKTLAVVVFMLLSLVSGFVEYPMPYASYLVSCSVVWRYSWCSACP